MTAGHKKALKLIAENKRTRSPFLDLGNLGLTEVPGKISEVFKTSEISHLAPFLQIGKKEVPACQNQTSEVFKTSEVLNPLP